MTRIMAVSDPVHVTRLLKLYIDSTSSWELSAKEHAALLDVPTATWSRIKSGCYRGRLNQDKVSRIQGVVTINKLIIDAELPRNWIACYNALPGYDGLSPLKKILDNGILGMHYVALTLQEEGKRA